MEIKEMESYLLKPAYRNSDVQALAGVSKNWATRIMHKCREMGGAIDGRPQHITAESYWRYQGTTLDEQLRRVRLLKGE